jgi:hypothetical protein
MGTARKNLPIVSKDVQTPHNRNGTRTQRHRMAKAGPKAENDRPAGEPKTKRRRLEIANPVHRLQIIQVCDDLLSDPKTATADRRLLAGIRRDLKRQELQEENSRKAK